MKNPFRLLRSILRRLRRPRQSGAWLEDRGLVFFIDPPTQIAAIYIEPKGNNWIEGSFKKGSK